MTRLPAPTMRYDPEHLNRVQRILEDALNKKLQNDQEINPKRFVLTAPNGSRWLVGVDNTGTLTTTAL